MFMIRPYQLTVVLIGLIYGTAFSLCTLITLGDLFFRKVKRTLLFPIISGAVFGILEFVQNLFFGGVDLSLLYLLHTLAAFLILTEKSKDSFISLIFAELFSASLIGSMQTAVFSVARGAERSFPAVTLLYLASYFISSAFVLMLKLLVRSDDREPLGKLQMFLLSGIMFSVTNLIGRSFAMSDYVPDVSPDAAIPSALMMMSVTVLLLLSVKQQQAKRFRELNELGEKYMTAQARHFERSRDADAKMRMLRHDMKNHITMMNGLYKSGKTEELGSYLKGLSDSFAETQSVNITGNEIADAIISEKSALAEKNGTKLVTEGSLKGLKSNAVTLCTVLSNLLDNAIEAAAVINTDRIIKLSAKRSDSFYYISISNPTAKSVAVSTDIPTSKHDSAHHGLGLKSVRSAVEKCGGTLELSCKKSRDGYEFTAEVILPVES